MQYAVGTHVTTPHGGGVIAAYNPQEKMYDVTIGETVMKLPRKDLLVKAAEDRSSEEEEDTTPGVIPSESSHQANEEEVPVQVECEGENIPCV